MAISCVSQHCTLARSLEGSEGISGPQTENQRTDTNIDLPRSLARSLGGDMQQLSIKGAAERRREEAREGVKEIGGCCEAAATAAAYGWYEMGWVGDAD